MAVNSITIPNILGDPEEVIVTTPGEASAAESKPVTFSTENKAIFTAIQTNTATLSALLDALTDVNGNLKAAFYHNTTPLDPSAAGPVIGGTAADAVLAFAPVTTGGLAKTANPTAVGDGDVVNALNDKLGKRVSVSALREAKAFPLPATFTTNAELPLVPAGGAGVFNDIYGLIITNTSATAVTVTIRDDTAGTIRYVFAVGAGQTTGFSRDAGSAARQSAANKPWTVQVSTGVSSIIITPEYVANL